MCDCGLVSNSVNQMLIKCQNACEITDPLNCFSQVTRVFLNILEQCFEASAVWDLDPVLKALADFGKTNSHFNYRFLYKNVLQLKG